MRYFLLLLFVCFYFSIFAQGTGWVLQSEKDGVKLYTKPPKADGTLQIRLIASTTASIKAVLNTSRDVSNVKERIVNTKSINILKQVSINEAYYQIISDFPWPLSDRDAILHAIITQDPTSKVVKVDTYSTPSYIAENKDYVRIYTWETHSISTPKPNGTVEIDYWVNYNPRGPIPDSILESITKESSINGIKKFIELTHAAKYQ